MRSGRLGQSGLLSQGGRRQVRGSNRPGMPRNLPVGFEGSWQVLTPVSF